MVHRPLPLNAVREVVFAAEDSLERLGDARVLVTGATGAIGIWVAEALCEYGRESGREFDVTLMSRRPPSTAIFSSPSTLARLAHVDIRTMANLPNEYSHVIHGAAPASMRSGSLDDRFVWETIELGSRRLALALCAQVNPPEVLLNLSSGAVNGIAPPGSPPIREDQQFALPEDGTAAVYAVAKRTSEAILDEAFRFTPTRTLHARLFSFFGAGIPLSDRLAIGNYVRDALNSGSIQVAGSGESVRSYMSLKDLATVLLKLLATHGSGPVNVGGTRGQTLQQWAMTVGSVSGKPVEILGGGPDPKPFYVPDLGRLTELLGPFIQEDPREVIRSWLAWAS